MPKNTNGKMGQRLYIEKILEQEIYSWLQAHYDLILKKNGD